MKRFKIEAITVMSFVLCWVLTYFAIFEDVQGALNVMEFIIGLAFITAFILHAEACQEVLMKKVKDRSYLTPLNVASDIVMVFVYVWYDHMIIGLFLLLGTVINEAAYATAKKKAQDAETAL